MIRPMNHAAPQQSSSTAPPQADAGRSLGRIVVCDDEPHITLAVSLKLRRAGFEVETHEDGRSAWESIALNPPALIVTDCQMPRMSGLDLIRSVRAHAATAKTPAIMLTGKGFELSEAEMQVEMGPVLLFSKPFSPRTLLDSVERLMGVRAA
ncbi:response regulator [Alienimonas chondri]|uniref:Regulator of RpoS n=1 Tax=Alienimonas chondri TaxID=2681879 RepID=A0ABX1V704_9PLAN|nr:response regulator [Alienimonas chondri]NNJ24054.1 Regulator of RpoS [Alienimonas chondri]